MKISLHLDVPQETIISYLEKCGYEVKDYDFGCFRDNHGSSEKWEENMCLGVMTPGGKKKIEEAFAEHIAPTIERKLNEISF